MTADEVKQIALECGFDLAGIAPAEPVPDYQRYQAWTERGMAGRMSYLTDRRGDLRAAPRLLLPSARSVLCVGKLYNGPEPTIASLQEGHGWISRYAWGRDYHDVLREGLEHVVEKLRCQGVHFESRICVDTAPVLERSLARLAGLGWIGKNTCLINEGKGSWFFLGELLLSLDLETDSTPPDRCGTCTRCIDACPTAAIVPEGRGWTLDARRCISYLTIELKGPVPEELREGIGAHLFGCDICQDVCPWNSRAPVDRDECFAPTSFAPSLEELASLGAESFHARFAGTPILRTKCAGLLRNVLTAMGNEADIHNLSIIEKLTTDSDVTIGEHARWARANVGRPPSKVEN